jgi:DNA-binding transcriptional LysR family regulator
MEKLRFVVQRESTDADIQNYMKQNHLDIQTRYHVVDDLSTVVMVASGFGICIMPELVMNDIPYEVRQYRMEPDAARIIGLAARGPHLMAPAVRTLYNHILNMYSNLE